MKMFLKSTISLFVAFILLFLFSWGLKAIGALISDFTGTLFRDGITIKATSSVWHLKHVLWIYLFPYLGFVIIYFLFFNKRKIHIKFPDWAHLVFSWTYTLILITVFFIPLCEIFNHTGIYYALSWMSMNRLEQYSFGLILMLLFVLRVFRVSSVFSSDLNVSSNTFLKSSIIAKQLPLLWYIPYLLLLLVVLLISDDFSFSDNFLLIGIGLTIIVNTPLIVSYKVVVK